MTIADHLARVWTTAVLGIPLGGPDGGLPREQQPGEGDAQSARGLVPAVQVHVHDQPDRTAPHRNPGHYGPDNTGYRRG